MEELKYYPLIAFALALLTSCAFQWFWIPFCSRKLMDIPNNRSSHQLPTPRGGGLGFVLAFSGITLVMGVQLDSLFWVGLALVSGIGLLDDFFKGIPASLRLVVHIIAATLCVFSYPLSNWPLPLPIAFSPLLGWSLAMLWVVGLINLTNFLDGIDGFTASQTALILGWLYVQSYQISALILVGAILGFLVWNWPPARIFMGDVGSGSLGYLMAALSLRSDQPEANVLGILCVGFIFFGDAFFTLLWRMATRQKFWQAHRTHLYQKWTQAGRSHAFVTTFYLAMGLIVALLSLLSERPFGWSSALILLGTFLIFAFQFYRRPL